MGLFSLRKKLQVLEFLLKHFSLHRISKKTKVPKSTAWDFLEKCRKLENGHYCNAKKVDRPKKNCRKRRKLYLFDSNKISFFENSTSRKS